MRKTLPVGVVNALIGGLLVGFCSTTVSAQSLDDVFRTLLQGGNVRIDAPPAPQRAARSNEVAQAQGMLNALGYDAGPVDGAFGRRTLLALNAFQRARNLPLTTWIDPPTFQVLTLEAQARATPPPVAVAPPQAGAAGCTTLTVAGLKADGDGFLAVRSGPGTQYDMQDKLYNGDVVESCGGAQDGWVAVIDPATGSLGWAYSQWLVAANTIAPPETPAPPGIVLHPHFADMLSAEPVESGRSDWPADAAPITAAMLAAMVVPVIEPDLDDHTFDTLVADFFKTRAGTIGRGQDPPPSPLPNELLEGRLPEVIASLNRDRLRAVLHENALALPVTVSIEKTVNAYFVDGVGVIYDPLGGTSDPLRNLTLSSRDLPIYNHFLFNAPWGNRNERSYAVWVAERGSPALNVELDRVPVLDPIPVGIEAAAARGLVGSRGERDQLLMTWLLDITEVRSENRQVIFSAAFRGLTLNWESDGALLAKFSADDFTTIAALRQALEGSLPGGASAVAVTVPDNLRFGAETADLLQLRHRPDSVDDQVVQRMMTARYAYEWEAAQPAWGYFFADLIPERREAVEKYGQPADPVDPAVQFAEFRAWSEARAAALPKVVTVRLPLTSWGVALQTPYHKWEDWRCPYSAPNNAGPDDEISIVTGKICDFLGAAWRSPEPYLFLAGKDLDDAESRGLRSYCGDGDIYCSRLTNEQREMIGADFILLDRLPSLGDDVRAMKGDFDLEIDVEPTGVELRDDWPTSIWRSAHAAAVAFGEPFGLSMWSGEPRPPEYPPTVFVAKAVAARVVERASGAVVAEPALAAIPDLPAELLSLPESETVRLDILGIRLGTSFAEADKLIREHMEVGEVVTADRKAQFGSVTGAIEPYTSGRMYVAADGMELITIFDEPPAAPETVVGMWRLVHRPSGEIDPASLGATLTERYGQPSEIKEVRLSGMRTGLGFLWFDRRHEKCVEISKAHQIGLWRDGNGDPSWVSAFRTEPVYPILGARHDELRVSDYCAALLGVIYETHDGGYGAQLPGDEILTWLSDNRAYWEIFRQSLSMPATLPAADATTKPKIKF